MGEVMAFRPYPRTTIPHVLKKSVEAPVAWDHSFETFYAASDTGWLHGATCVILKVPPDRVLAHELDTCAIGVIEVHKSVAVIVDAICAVFLSI